MESEEKITIPYNYNGMQKNNKFFQLKARKSLKLEDLTIYGSNYFFRRFSGHNLR